MDNRGGLLDAGFVLTIVMLAIFVVAALSTATSGIFASVGSGLNGTLGFIVTYFNVVLLFALTIVGFVVLLSGR